MANTQDANQQSAQSPQELQAQVEQTRAELADTVDQLTQRTDVKARAKDAGNRAVASGKDTANRAAASGKDHGQPGGRDRTGQPRAVRHRGGRRARGRRRDCCADREETAARQATEPTTEPGAARPSARPTQAEIVVTAAL